MIIYALSTDSDDHREEGGRTVPRPHSPGSPDDTQTINVLRSYSIEWLTNDIKNRVDGFRGGTGRADTKIWLLRISSHGHAGLMYIGRGLDRETAEQFNVLADDYFVPYAEGGQGIELWGCSVASAQTIDSGVYDIDTNNNGIYDAWSDEALDIRRNYTRNVGLITRTPSMRRGAFYPADLRGERDFSGSVEEGSGYRMMHALARAANTKVTAAYDIQLAELNGLDWQWEGTGLLTVFPDGDYETTPLV